MKEKTNMVDEALELTGGFGKFQWYLLGVMAYCMTTLGLQGITMTFIADEPGWKCLSNSSVCNLTGLHIVGSEFYNLRCSMSENDWEYESTVTSIVTQYKLYCDRSILKNVATSMVYLGWFIGAICFGMVSDIYGRKKALVTSMVVMAASGVVSSFSIVFWFFALLKVFVGAGIGGAMTCIFILNTEFAGPKKRGFAGIFVWNFWVLGLSFVALVAYLINDWRYINMITSFPGLMIVFFAWKLPESIRWMLVHGKNEEARSMLHKVAVINGVKYQDLWSLDTINIGENKSGNVFELFKTCKLGSYTLACMFIWFTCSMTYYGISLSAGQLGGNIYLVFFLTNIITIPANFLAIFLIDNYGRKKVMIITLTSTAASMICAALFPHKEASMGFTVGRVAMAMSAKFLITIAFDAAYLITYEICPTTLRYGYIICCSTDWIIFGLIHHLFGRSQPYHSIRHIWYSYFYLRRCEFCIT